MSDEQSQVLPFTLAELFVLVFFALALGLAYESIQRDQAEDELNEAQAVVEDLEPIGESGRRALARMLDRGQDEFPNDFKELVRTVQDRGKTRRIMERELDASDSSSSYLDTASLSTLADSLAQQNIRNRERAEAFLKASNLSDVDSSAVERLAEEKARLAARASNLRGQLKYLREQVGDGLDHPPCWADSLGRPIYALEVTLHTEVVDVMASWPERLEERAQQVPGLTSTPGNAISYQEFRRRSQPILRWSKQQEPECRHFVTIRDSVKGGKVAFKNGLLTVEDYFYKYLVQ